MNRPKFHLFTLDVKALYPSIRPDVALESLVEAFGKDTTTPTDTKTTLLEMAEMLFEHSYIKCKEACYRPKEGIPTGGCNSRQTADCTLHKVIEAAKANIPLWSLIDLFKRFIDDIFGVWKGTKRQFTKFVELLNHETMKFGIEFGEYSVGDLVNFLDCTVYVDKEGLLQYKLFRKPTDSRLYLKKHSFHPPHVFDAVAYSQMLRVAKRNSQSDQAESDITELQKDLEKCGHDPENLENLRVKLNAKLLENPSQSQSKEDIKNEGTTNTITAVVNQFQELNQLKKLMKSIETDIDHLVGGNTRVLVATRKGMSVRNKVVKNKQLCETEPPLSNTQQCGAPKCKSCPLLTMKKGEVMMVNGFSVKTPNRHLNCKTKNAIYVAKCTLCDDNLGVDCVYTGQTQQRVHQRINGHRSCFVADQPDTIEKSALALHAKEKHPTNFDLSIFKFMIRDSVSPRDLNRRESSVIGGLRTNVMGLNRMNIQK